MMLKQTQLQTTKAQHVVPKCYLKAWCDQNGRLHAYKIETGHTSRPSRRSAATREFIYDTEETLNLTDPDNYQIFERTFGKIEDKAAPVFEAIIANARRANSAIIIPPEFLRISDELAHNIARLSVIQFLRDARQINGARIRWNDWLKQVWDATVPLFFDPADEPELEFESVDDDFLTLWLIEFLKDRLLKFSQILSDKILVIGLNKTGKKLLTSDSPVHWGGYYIDASANWDGINSRSSRLVYPLAPDVCVIFYDREFYGNQRSFHKTVRSLMPEEIEEFNVHLTHQSDKQVFSSDGDFSHAQYALSQRQISGERWGQHRSSPVPQDLLELVVTASDTCWSQQELFQTRMEGLYAAWEALSGRSA